jgi:hypothetical protein
MTTLPPTTTTTSRRRTRALALLGAFGFLALAALAAAVLAPRWNAGPAHADDADEGKLSARVFEMRTYHTAPGKLGDLHKRFREHTSYLFVKHGMTLVGYWTPVDETDTLVYILAYPSKEAREASWKAFLDDAEWKRVFEASHEAAGGKIVTKVESRLLEPTDYSPIR